MIFSISTLEMGVCHVNTWELMPFYIWGPRPSIIGRAQTPQACLVGWINWKIARIGSPEYPTPTSYPFRSDDSIFHCGFIETVDSSHSSAQHRNLYRVCVQFLERCHGTYVQGAVKVIKIWTLIDFNFRKVTAFASLAALYL